MKWKDGIFSRGDDLIMPSTTARNGFWPNDLRPLMVGGMLLEFHRMPTSEY